jgi:hypothetical protein
MAGNLVTPRVRVTWGDINLSSYNGTGTFPQDTPLVYDVEVEFQSQSNAPTGTMKWDPTGPGFAEYERFISSPEYMQSRIYVEFFYVNGKRLRLAFVWAGQSISYGTDMTVTINLKSELDGLINANIRNVTQAYDEKKGGSMIDSLNKGTEQFKIPNKSLLRFNEKAKKDLEKAKIITNYAQDQTYGAFISNTVQQNGNVAFANNIEEPNITIFTPYSWDKDGEVLNAATEVPYNSSPLPEKRYGYILGPSNITSIQRQSQWNPPQQTTQNTPNTQMRARDNKGRFISQKPATAAQRQVAATTTASSSPLGTANARPNPGIQNKDNPDGPTKQNLLTEEGTATLTFQTFLSPLLVGIKPFDIVYVPSLKGDFIEDWIVDTVSYDQNDGNVTVNVQAKRILGLGTPMNKKNADKFSAFAKAQGLIGPTATLESWDKYTWSPLVK